MQFDAGVAVIGDQEVAVVEWSRDGAVMVKISMGWSSEDVQVQLEPLVTAWPADVLADRIMRLHRLALMRARAEARLRLIEKTGLALAVTSGSPTMAEVDEYRRTIDF